jgi:hypothetical protein
MDAIHMPKKQVERSKPNPQRASLEFEVIAWITSTGLESFSMAKVLCKELLQFRICPVLLLSTF